MLVFGRENWRYHRSWCVATVMATTAALVGYLCYGCASGSWNWPGGGSPPGFAYGLVGGGIILFEMLLWPRKSLWRGWRLGRTKLWMTAHIWLGLLTLPLLLLHGSFQFSLATSTLAAVLMWLLVLVVSSGAIGLVFQNIVPRLMLEQVPAETIYSQIGHILEQYRDEAERLVELTCGRSPVNGDGSDDRALPREPATAAPSFVSLGSVRTVGRQQGNVVQVGIEAVWVPGSEALLTFYQEQIGPYLCARSGRRLLLGSPAKATAMFQALKARLRPECHPVVDRLADLCNERRQFDLQARLHFWLHSWLGAHVALSVALTLLMLAHAVLALKYL
jgi:hypothetical protein